ncbi:MAG: MFS transporter, partial [Dehalococcoidia bacterium]
MSAPPPTVPAGGLRHATGAFEAPGFRAVFAGAVLFSLGQWTERVAIGWFVFDATDSAFLTAATTAAHAAPAIFVGPIAGAVSDRAPRPGVLGGASVLKAVAVLVIAALVATEGAAIGLVLALVALSGIGATFHLSSLHTLSGDLVGPD